MEFEKEQQYLTEQYDFGHPASALATVIDITERDDLTDSEKVALISYVLGAHYDAIENE